MIKYLERGAFGKVVLAKKKSTGSHNSSEEVFALKFIPNKHVSGVEKEVFLRAVGHPFLVQLHAYFRTRVSRQF
jgi:serine/threonine protein kinase